METEKRFMYYKVTVLGKRYSCKALEKRDVKPGALIRWQVNRSAYRIVCLDGDDAILRNLRSPHLLEAVPAASLLSESWRLVPEGAE